MRLAPTRRDAGPIGGWALGGMLRDRRGW
jgi:hypothetical protein